MSRLIGMSMGVKDTTLTVALIGDYTDIGIYGYNPSIEVEFSCFAEASSWECKMVRIKADKADLLETTSGLRRVHYSKCTIISISEEDMKEYIEVYLRNCRAC